MTERKPNDFTPQPPPPSNQTGWRAFPITVDFPIPEKDCKEQENGEEDTSES